MKRERESEVADRPSSYILAGSEISVGKSRLLLLFGAKLRQDKLQIVLPLESGPYSEADLLA